jgi:glycosyltransferase domain-containing protein
VEDKNETNGSLTTILIPLKDNSRKTVSFLQRNIHPHLNYYFADGSLGTKNEEIFSKIDQSNIKFVRFPPDESNEYYYRKMHLSATDIKTPYVMTVDAGDIIFPNFIGKAEKVLNGDDLISACGGDIYFGRQILHVFTKPYLANSPFEISNLSAESALRKVSKNYQYLWYSIQRKAVFEKTWEIIRRSGIQHPFMEFLPTVSILSCGKYRHLPDAQLLRIKHGPFSWTKQSSKFNSTYLELDANLKQFGQLIQKEFGIQEDLVVLSFQKETTKVGIDLYGLRKGPVLLKKSQTIQKLLISFPIMKRIEKTLAHFAGLIFPANKDADWFSVFRLFRFKSIIEDIENRR